MAKITCFGEVLWDVFPEYKKIGGAPLNVANRLSSFKHDVTIISAVGKDEAGEKIFDFLKENNINIESIQMLNQYKTGEVEVTLTENGSTSYKILYPRAWDKISLTNTAKLVVKSSDAFVFGSLVTRDDTSKKTLFELIGIAKYKIFDINLRTPYYSEDVLLYLMQKADFIKFNDEELYKISKVMGSKYHSLEQNMMYISEKTNTKHLCVTKGSHGAVLLYEGELFYNSGFLIEVIDTVGAGDSFLATLISQLLNKVTPQKAINYACAVGALVAQNEGANPKITFEAINEFINPS